MHLNQKEALDIFEQMLLMRRFEEMVIQISTEEEYFFGHFHVYIGQEATGASVIAQLTEHDLITTTHRNHGHLISRGADPGRVLAEIMGRIDGYNGGRSGTLHLTARSLGFLSTSAVVGGSAGIGTGAAYALKNSDNHAIAVSFFGDGALEEGIVFESLNIAVLYNLPILFMCENNSYGAGGAAAGEYPSSVISTSHLIDIPLSLNMQAEVVDGADADAVYKAAGEAIQTIRNGDGPVFLETSTERWPGTRPLWPELLTGVTDISTAWESANITGEHSEWIKVHDPILRHVREMLEAGYADKEGIIAVDARINNDIETAREFAVNSPLPDPDTFIDHVFA